MVEIAFRQAVAAVLTLTVLTLLSLQTGLIPIRAAEFDRTTLTVTEPSGTEKGTLSVGIAESLTQQIIGLSRTESLDPDGGLLFPHDEQGGQRVEMRNLDFGLDVLFVDADGEITGIRTLDAPDSPIEYYLTYDSASGVGQYVVEANAGWCAEHGVTPGDRVTGIPETT
jgi:uncharacterized membrane protein (UPF0127 family)